MRGRTLALGLPFLLPGLGGDKMLAGLEKFFGEANLNTAILSVLLAVIFVQALGKGGGKLLVELLKKLFGHGGVTVEVNQKESPCQGDPRNCPAHACQVDPSLCPAHQAENERSLRNEGEIKELWTAHTDLRKELGGKLDSLVAVNQKILLVLATPQSKRQKLLQEDL